MKSEVRLILLCLVIQSGSFGITVGDPFIHLAFHCILYLIYHLALCNVHTHSPVARIALVLGWKYGFLEFRQLEFWGELWINEIQINFVILLFICRTLPTLADPERFFKCPVAMRAPLLIFINRSRNIENRMSGVDSEESALVLRATSSHTRPRLSSWWGRSTTKRLKIRYSKSFSHIFLQCLLIAWIKQSRLTIVC